MIKCIELARKITKDMDKNWLPEMEEINIHRIFSPIYKMNFNLSNLNAIVAFCIFAYDNDSTWMNLRQDRYDNKISILSSLTEDYNTPPFIAIAKNENDKFNEIIGEYLIEQTTWKWRQIMISLDFHSNTLRFVGKKTETERQIETKDKDGNKDTLTEEYNIDLIAKVSKQKGELLDQALKARQSADLLLSEIKKEFVQLDHAVQQDFNFEITDEKKIDPLSWRDFIRERNRKKSISA